MVKRQVLVFLTVTSLVLSCGQKNADSQGKVKGTITLSGAWALYPMAVGGQKNSEKSILM